MGSFKKGALIGFGIGYLQGAKAGRPRYEQIMQKARKIDLGPVKETGDKVLGKVMAKTAGIKGGGSHNPPASDSQMRTTTTSS